MKIFDLLSSNNLSLPYRNDKLGIESLLKNKYNIFIRELNEFNQAKSSDSMEHITKGQAK